MASGVRICAFLLILSSALPAYAQPSDVEQNDVKRTQRQLDMDDALRDAAEEAEAMALLHTKDEVTYEQVLADPDNLDLNFRYAKSQVARGEMTGASATLERILMVDPNLPPIRLFYALVLYRLDNLDEAERELKTVLEAPELPESERTRVKQTLKAIHRRRARTTWSASTTIGYGFDTNRNAAPSSKERLVFDLPVGLEGTSIKRHDTHFLFVQNLSVAHELGSQAGHQLFASLDYFLGEQTTVDDLDIASYSAEGGGTFKLPQVSLTPTINISLLTLSRESYLRSHGLGLRLDRPLGDRVSASLDNSWTREDYYGITESEVAPERTGNRFNVLGGLRYVWRPTVQLGLETGYENKGIRGPAEYNAYEGLSLTGSGTWLLGQGQFLLSSLTWTRNIYDEPDTSISARIRRDNQLRARIAYGAPLQLLTGGWLPEAWLADTTAVLTFEQFRSLSNITNYTYSNSKIDLLVTRRVDF